MALSGGRTTLKDIAQHADTSTMAVSVVLNGARSNTRVSESTRRRILSVAADLNYSPNAMARGLKRQRTNTLGVLFSWASSRAIHNLYSVAVLDGVVEGAAEAGYHILLYTKSWKNATISSVDFSDRRTDGVVVVAPPIASDVITGLVALDLPVTVVSAATDISDVPYVSIDNRHGVALALDHLRDLGHTRIAYAGLPLDRYSMRERFDAYCKWLAQNGLPLRDEHVILNLHPAANGQNVGLIERLLRLPDRPTAIFVATDDLAADFLGAARGMGVDLPRELSVVGFDDILVASLTTPKLTTIRQPLFEMGRQAAELLIAKIEGRGETDPPAHIVTPTLVVRESTAPPPDLSS